MRRALGFCWATTASMKRTATKALTLIPAILPGVRFPPVGLVEPEPAARSVTAVNVDVSDAVDADF